MAQCKVCSHSRAKEINRLLLTGTPVARVAKAASMCRGTVWHHFQKHLPWRPQRRPKPVTIQEQIEDLKFELHRLQILGECGEAVGGAVTALRERRQVLELEARLEGKLDATHRKLLTASAAPGEFEVVFVDGRARTIEKAG